MVPQTNLYGFERRPATVDRAFAQFLTSVYGWMAAGLSLSAVTAYSVAHTPALLQVIMTNRVLSLGIMLAQFGLVIAMARKVSTVSQAVAGWMFMAYSLLTGISLSMLFVVYTGASLAQCFLTSAAAFAGLSLYGVATRRSLSQVGQFCFFGLIGLLVATVVNIFLHSTALQFIGSCAGVVIFGGLTMYDSQRLKELYMMTGGAGNLAVHGALMLYLDFLNLFLSLLQLFGQERRR